MHSDGGALFYLLVRCGAVAILTSKLESIRSMIGIRSNGGTATS